MIRRQTVAGLKELIGMARLFIMGLVVALWLAVFSGHTKLPADDAKGPNSGATILSGRVTNADGAGLAGVRVRIAIPAADMRFVDPTSPHKQMETKTDARGDYRLEIPEIKDPTSISIDAMKPGYRRLVGTLMSGGDSRTVKVVPGNVAAADLTLLPALYFAGTVVDEQGKPISGVQISANADSSNASGGVERTASNSNGSFELFNYAKEPVVFNDGLRTKGAVSFFHEDYLDHQIADVYALEPRKRETLRIVLMTGYTIAGTVIDANGKPVPKAMVKAIRTAGTHRKATVTDENGKFALRGLDKGLTKLSVRALAIRQKALVPLALKGDKQDLEIQLRDIELPRDLRTYEVLGMQLADLTPDVKDAYSLWDDKGAVIVDPGENSDRLQIGKLAESYCFWMVGKERVGSVREFIEKILAETAGGNAMEFSIRVVYSFSTVDFDGTNTQYLRLTKSDVEQLQATLDEILGEKQ
jgi:hypothetical protein